MIVLEFVALGVGFRALVSITHLRFVLAVIFFALWHNCRSVAYSSDLLTVDVCI